MEPVPAGLLHDYGDLWQIERDAGLGLLKAIQRVPVLRSYLAETEADLRQLLDNDRELHQF
jgi:hypothetical protein